MGCNSSNQAGSDLPNANPPSKQSQTEKEMAAAAREAEASRCSCTKWQAKVAAAKGGCKAAATPEVVAAKQHSKRRSTRPTRTKTRSLRWRSILQQLRHRPPQDTGLLPEGFYTARTPSLGADAARRRRHRTRQAAQYGVDQGSRRKAQSGDDRRGAAQAAAAAPAGPRTGRAGGVYERREAQGAAARDQRWRV